MSYSAPRTQNDNLSSFYDNDPEKYVPMSEAYKGLLSLVPANLPQNNIVPGTMVRNFYGQHDGTAFAKNDNPPPLTNCSMQFAYSEPLCQK